MIKIVGIVVMAAAIAFGASPAISKKEPQKISKKCSFKKLLRNTVVFVAESAVNGTSQDR